MISAPNYDEIRTALMAMQFEWARLRHAAEGMKGQAERDADKRDEMHSNLVDRFGWTASALQNLDYEAHRKWNER